MVDVAFKCFLMKSSSLIIDLTVLVDFRVVVDVEVGRVDVDITSGGGDGRGNDGTLVSSNSKSLMKLVKFDEIFLKLGSGVVVVVLEFSCC